MKKLVPLLCIISVFATSCVPTGVIQIKGRYQEGPVRMKMNIPSSGLWDRVIDLIADVGLNVKLIDKASGLVVSDPVSFVDSFSHEDKAGVIIDKSAYIVTSRMNDGSPPGIKSLTASWNLRVKEGSSGESIVSILLYNIDVNDPANTYLHRGKSTGNFEKWLLRSLYDRE